MTSPRPGSSDGTTQSLAAVLAAGPMRLPDALRCATEIASALRDLHDNDRGYGKLTASSVILAPGGAQLLPSRYGFNQVRPASDLPQFGALLFHMLTGVAPLPGDIPSFSRTGAPRSGAAGLRASVLQIASNCIAEENRLTIQQVNTELRLLAVLLRMEETRGGPAPELPAAPLPFLIAPPAEPAPVSAVQSSPGTTLVPLGPASFGQPAPKKPAEVQPLGGACPKCDSPVVYVARPRSRFEEFLVRMKVPLCRCHSCYHRYVVFARVNIGKQMPTGTDRKARPHRRKR